MGSRLSFQLSPREWTDDRCRRLQGARRSVTSSRQRCVGALEQLSGNLYLLRGEDCGRASDGRFVRAGKADSGTYMSSLSETCCSPTSLASSASVLQESPSHNRVRPLLWASLTHSLGASLTLALITLGCTVWGWVCSPHWTLSPERAVLGLSQSPLRPQCCW